MLYNYKSDDTVQDVILDSIDKLTEDIESEFETLRRYNSLFIYSPAFLAREIIAEIFDDLDDAWIHEEAHFDLLKNDDNEVIISLSHDGMIFIEEARSRNGELKYSDFSTLIYVYDGFSKRDVDWLASDGESVLVFGFDQDALDEFEDYEIEGERVSKDEFDAYVNEHTVCESDKNIVTSESNERYSINGKSVSKEEFEEMYTDSILNMLFGYCEFMDEMNTLRSRLLRW